MLSVGYPTVRLEYTTKPLGTNSHSFRLTLEGCLHQQPGLGSITVSVIFKKPTPDQFQICFQRDNLRHRLISRDTNISGPMHSSSADSKGTQDPAWLKDPTQDSKLQGNCPQHYSSITATHLQKYSAARCSFRRAL